MVDAVNIFRKISMDKLSSEDLNKIFRDSRIALTKNETKDVIKVVRSLENREILLKGTIRKISSQKVGFLNFPSPLISVVSLLMKNILTSLVKRFGTIKINGSRAATADIAVQNKMFGSGTTALIILKKK